VEDAVLVRVVHRPRHSGHHVRDPILPRLPLGGGRLRVPGGGARQAELAQARVQAAAIDQLHGEVGPAVILADVVDGDDVGVVEVARGRRLDVEALQGVGRPRQAAQDHLEGDLAVDAHLPGPVDDAHAAARDLAEQLVIAEALRRGPRAPGRAARRGQRRQLVAVGEEVVQLRRQVGVPGDELLAVGRPPGLLGLEVVRQGVVQPALPCRGGRFVADHDPVLLAGRGKGSNVMSSIAPPGGNAMRLRPQG
jgi:hypothetical protein